MLRAELSFLRDLVKREGVHVASADRFLGRIGLHISNLGWQAIRGANIILELINIYILGMLTPK
jgi:hypothetical protein